MAQETAPFYAPGFELPRQRSTYRDTGKPTSFDRLVSKCNTQGIVCERTGRKIELTTPCGSVTAVCLTIAEAWDTYNEDPAFHALPLRQYNARR